MIQIICPECRGKGQVKCQACQNMEKDERKNCAVCSGTGFTLCLACMGGGLIDTNAYA